MNIKHHTLSCCIVLILSTGISNSLLGQFSFHSSGKAIDNSQYSTSFTVGEILNKGYNETDYAIKNGVIQFFLNPISSVSNLDEIGIEIYPNPVSDFLIIGEEESMNGFYRYQILDLRGRLIREGALNTNRLATTALDPASYLLKVYSDESYATQLFIKL